MSEGNEGQDDDLFLKKIGSVETTVQCLVELRNRDGKISMKTYNDAIAYLLSNGIDIKLNALQRRVSRACKVGSDGQSPIEEVDVLLTGEGSEVSSLTNPSYTNRRTEELSSKTGRPKGTTMEHKKEKKEKYKQCVHSITEDYAALLSSARDRNTRVAKGALSKLIHLKREEYDIDQDISPSTIRTRTRPGRQLTPKSRGVMSPVAEVEETLVAICIQMGKIRQPLNVTEGILLMNDLIMNTTYQDRLQDFHVCCKLGSDNFQVGTVTKGWWYGFKSRNRHRIVTRRGERFACNRADWTKLKNIEQMYDVIYDEMVDARVARVLEYPVFTDISGKEVDESQRFGKKQDIEITHKQYILFADETGCNTSQKKDGHISGTKYIVERGSTPQTMASDTDHKFTLLPFTSANGEAICCVVIFQHVHGNVPISWRTGFDATVEPIRDKNGNIDFERNLGPGTFQPGGPTCTYNGKEVECLVYSSEGGGITGEILVSIVTYFDYIELFPRIPGGPIPLLILDGHQSRLHPAFIKYINDEDHLWKVCFGVPYATTIWQVGDASELNGKFKTEWYREKQNLLSWKYERQLPRGILPHDVMPILNKIFHKAYGSVVHNQKAVADRGWCPPNRKLLEHPCFDTEEGNSSSTTRSSSDPPSTTTSCLSYTLNISNEDGIAASVLDRMLSERARYVGARRVYEKRKKEGYNAVQNIRDARRLTTGVLTANGIHSLQDPKFLCSYHERQKLRTKKEEKAMSMKRAKKKKNVNSVLMMRSKHGHEMTHQFAHCSAEECASYLQYKKKDKDPQMPTALEERRHRCREWTPRPSPLSSPTHSEDEEDIKLEDSSADVVSALLGLSSNNLTFENNVLKESGTV